MVRRRFARILVMTLTCRILNAQWADHVVLSEIRYDERSGVNEEFVELYNPAGEAVSLEGWRLMYKSKTGTSWFAKVTFAAGDVIPGWGYYLWGGADLSVTADRVETSQSALGLSNSGGHIALHDASGSVVDRVAWEGGDSPEGSGDAGRTGDGGSLERKASASSTAESMEEGGPEESAGNGWDTDDNAADFVIHDLQHVFPQNTKSPPEPGSAGRGTGTAVVDPGVVEAERCVGLRIILRSDSDRTIVNIGVVLPEAWGWSYDTDDVSLEGPGWISGAVVIRGDTIRVSGGAVTDAEPGTIRIRCLISPDSAATYVFPVLTAVAGETLLPIRDPPAIRVRPPVLRIIDLHRNDSEGRPAPPFSEGCSVRISGVITGVLDGFSGAPAQVFLQDATAGIRVSAPEWPVAPAGGDSVTLTGRLRQYFGMTEIVPVWDEWVVNGTGTVPEPAVLTCAEVRGTFRPDSTEPNEGRLVRVEGARCGPDATVIQDETGTAPLMAEEAAGVNVPAGTFDVTGLLIQHKPGAPPFASGYAILPRSRSDLEPVSGPRIVSGPGVIDWRRDGVTVRWETDAPATSRVYYRSPFVEDSVAAEEAVTDHRIDVGGLAPAQLVRYCVGSGNSSGRTLTGDAWFVTSSGPASTGEIRVAFSGSVDSGVAGAQAADGERDLAELLTGSIDLAMHSVDACFMKLTELDVRDALIDAKRRGVSVRMICDELYAERPEIQGLRDAGIPVISDAFGTNDGPAGTMHHKFAVFDHRDASTCSDDWVWTGSFHPAHRGDGPESMENVLLIQDQALAAIYTREFEEMWGSGGDVPNAAESRFGYRKLDDTPHSLRVGDTRLDVYFGPSDRTRDRLLEAVSGAERSIHFCIYSFTREDVARAMLDRWSSSTKFRLRGVFDRDQRDSDGVYSVWPLMNESTPRPDVWLDGEEGLLHHKYLLIDGDAPDANPVTVTGSYNWSLRAETVNDENTLFLEDASVANAYLQEFAERYRRAGGTDSIVSTVECTGSVPDRFRLFPNYPNPFNGATRIAYTLPGRVEVCLAVFDVTGRHVKTLQEGVQAVGRHVVDWSGDDDDGRCIPSAVYLVRLESGGLSQTRKMVFVR